MMEFTITPDLHPQRTSCGAPFAPGLVALRLAWILCGTVLMVPATSSAATSDELTPYSGAAGWEETRDERMAWHQEAKFGMLICYGPYTAAGGYWPPDPETGKRYPQHYAEWIRTWANVPEPEYGRATIPLLEPAPGCTREWARVAREAGMRYSVMIAKYHDGYTTFNSTAPYSLENAVTGSTNISPEGRDLIAEYADSMRAEGLKLGYYFSLIDWQHPDALSHGRTWALGPDPDHERYRQYMLHHVTQLFTDYGKVDIIWADYSGAGAEGEAWKTKEILETIHGLQPHVITNNRFWSGLENPYGDFFTPEKYVPPTGFPGRYFEVNHTMNESYGFSYHDQNWKSGKDVVHLLVDIVSKGGNLLLNVGPDPEGHIPQPSVAALRETGQWLEKHGEAIYGTDATPFATLPFKGCCTRQAFENGDTKLYFHLLEWPESGQLRLPEMSNELLSCEMLGGDGAALETSAASSGAVVLLPEKQPDSICSVVQVVVRGAPRARLRTVAQQDGHRRILVKADGAYLRGSTLKLDPIRIHKDFANIGHWSDREDSVLMPFVVTTPGASQAGSTVTSTSGRYAIFLDYAAAASCGGSLQVSAPEGQFLEVDIPETGGWGQYTRLKLGEITLGHAGQSYLLLEATEIRGDGFMNLESIELLPLD